MNTIAGSLQGQDILLDIEVASGADLLEVVGRHMMEHHGLAADEVVAGLARREQVGSTALGKGVAIPHCRISHLRHIQIAYLRLVAPIAFAAPDGLPVSDILVLLVPKQATEEHLVILAEAAEMFGDRRFRERLRNCADPMQTKREYDAWPRPAS